MAEGTKDADSIPERPRREKEFKDKDRVLVIHTKGYGVGGDMDNPCGIPALNDLMGPRKTGWRSSIHTVLQASAHPRDPFFANHR